MGSRLYSALIALLAICCCVSSVEARYPAACPPQDGPGDGGLDPVVPDEPTPNDEDEDTPMPEGVDYSSWVWWWQLNREPILDLRAKLGLYDPSLKGLPGLLPPQATETRRWGPRPSAASIGSEVLPALLKTLESSSSREVTKACLIALARVGEDQGGEDRAQVLGRIRPHLQDENQEVVETAVMALGILGNESASGMLSELLLDTPYGQRLVADSKVHTRARAFAAYSLGLLGARTQKEDVRRYGVYMLARALNMDKTRTPDLGVACVRGLGMMPLAWSGNLPSIGRGARDPVNASREAQLQYLLDILDKDRLHRQIQAFVPAALTQLLNADAAPRTGVMRQRVAKLLLNKYSASRRTERELRRSAAMALGLIGPTGDAELDQRIQKALARSDRDRITQNWSLMALGRIGAQRSDARDGVQRSLLQTLKREDGSEAEWAALGLGLMCFDAPDQGVGSDVLKLLSKRLKKSSRPSEVGAFGLALGLAGDPAAREALADKLARTEAPDTQGYLMLALALLGDAGPGQIERMLGAFEGAEARPLLLCDSATALALLGERSIVDRLVSMLRASHSSGAQRGLAQALGRMGDASAVAPLLEMLKDPGATETSRSFAAQALGLVADGDRLPWNTLISLDTNYSAAPPTLMDFEGHGILNSL